MVDQFGRAVDYLRLSVTDLCNYRCRYCMPEDGVCKRSHSDILRVEECVEIVRAAAGSPWSAGECWTSAGGSPPSPGWRSCV